MYLNINLIYLYKKLEIFIKKLLILKVNPYNILSRFYDVTSSHDT